LGFSDRASVVGETREAPFTIDDLAIHHYDARVRALSRVDQT
jgi:hypothetical protein